MELELSECKKCLAKEKARSDIIEEFYKDVIHSEKCGAHKCSYLQSNTSCTDQAKEMSPM